MMHCQQMAEEKILGTHLVFTKNKNKIFHWNKGKIPEDTCRFYLSSPIHQMLICPNTYMFSVVISSVFPGQRQ
jgi:hypothetical protein